MLWFCARQRLAQFWADALIPKIGVLTDDNDRQQIDRAVAQPAAGSFSDSADGLSWNRPGPDVDRPGLVRRPAGTHRPLTAVALDRTPYFDAAQRFIHPCSACGREGILGTGVNVRAGPLGFWYCGACKPPSSSLNKAPGETPVLDIANYERTEFVVAGTRDRGRGFDGRDPAARSMPCCRRSPADFGGGPSCALARSNSGNSSITRSLNAVDCLGHYRMTCDGGQRTRSSRHAIAAAITVCANDLCLHQHHAPFGQPDRREGRERGGLEYSASAGTA